MTQAQIRHLALRLHALGERPLFHFLGELHRGGDLRTSLERYATLPVDFIAANGGDRFGPSVFAIDGGRP